MMINPADVLRIASGEIGYREDPPGTNKNKFAADLDKNYPEWYYYDGGPHKKNGYDWCTIFHDWAFIKAYGVETARKLLYRPKENNYGAGVKFAWSYYRGAGRIAPNPILGCSVFFTSYKDRRYATHIGICSGVTDTYITVIEGNAGTDSQYVVEKQYRRDYSYLYGYGLPEYDTKPVTNYTPGQHYQVVCKDTLNLREAPDVASRRITAANPGTIIRCEDSTVDKKGNTWIKVTAYMCAVEDGHKYIE